MGKVSLPFWRRDRPFMERGARSRCWFLKQTLQVPTAGQDGWHLLGLGLQQGTFFLLASLSKKPTPRGRCGCDGSELAEMRAGARGRQVPAASGAACPFLLARFGRSTGAAYLEGAELLSACPDLKPRAGGRGRGGFFGGLFLQMGDDRNAPMPAWGCSTVPFLSDAEMWRAVGLLSWQMLCVDRASHLHPAAVGLLKYPQSRSPEVALAFLQSLGDSSLGGSGHPLPALPASSDVSAWVSPLCRGRLGAAGKAWSREGSSEAAGTRWREQALVLLLSGSCGRASDPGASRGCVGAGKTLNNCVCAAGSVAVRRASFRGCPKLVVSWCGGFAGGEPGGSLPPAPLQRAGHVPLSAPLDFWWLRAWPWNATSWGAAGDPVGVESSGTNTIDLQRSLAHLCAEYPAAGAGERSVGAVGSAAWTGLKLEQFLKGSAPRGDGSAGRMSSGRGHSRASSCTRCIFRDRSGGGLWRGAEGRARSIPSSLASPAADTEPFPAQILPRVLSCAVLLLLLLTVLSRGKRCSIAKILRQYRAVIFHEIQNLVSRGGSAQGMLPRWMRPRCGMWAGRDELGSLIWGWPLCWHYWGEHCL